MSLLSISLNGQIFSNCNQQSQKAPLHGCDITIIIKGVNAIPNIRDMAKKIEISLEKQKNLDFLGHVRIGIIYSLQ
jgi:hypothetical protein